MSRQVSPSTAQVYGLLRVTRLWGVSRATLYRHRRPTKVVERKRPGPLGAMADEDLVVAIRQLLTDSPFHGEGHRKLWARLRFAGIRTSRRRVLRLMRVRTACWRINVQAGDVAPRPTTARSRPIGSIRCGAAI
jgi:putative transposase